MNHKAVNQTISAEMPIIHTRAFDLASRRESSSDTLRLMVQVAHFGKSRRPFRFDPLRP
jgi:hypothetical protein